MAHVRCRKCGKETLDDVKLSITHKSVCKCPMKSDLKDYEIVGRSPKTTTTIAATVVIPTKSTSRSGGKKSRK